MVYSTAVAPCPQLFIPRKNSLQKTDISRPQEFQDQLANWLAIERWANNFPCGQGISAQLKGPSAGQASFLWSSFEFNDSGFSKGSSGGRQGIVVPKAGVYLVTYMISITLVSGAFTGTYLELLLFQNLTSRINAFGPWINTSGTTYQVSVTIANLVKCAANDNLNTSFSSNAGFSGGTVTGYLGASYQSA